MSALYVALIHHPIKDRAGETITTAVTNLDVHDIARSARTYGARGYFVVTPIEAQRQLVERILSHWRDGSGARRVPERREALARCEVLPSFEAARDAVTAREGRAPWVLSTGARPAPGTSPLSWAEARARIAEHPTLILFGTGHGLADAIVREADRVLAPIEPGSDYNHLSVRAAVAIALDRLRGDGGDGPR